MAFLLATAAASGSFAQQRSVAVAPDMNSVSDGPASYKVFTLTKKKVRDYTATFGDFQSCQIMVDVPIGIPGGNISHGALCIERKGPTARQVFTCYDDVVRHAGLVHVHGRDATKRNLILFTVVRCLGG